VTVVGRTFAALVALAVASCGGSTTTGAPDGGTSVGAGGSAGAGGTGGGSGSKNDGSIDCSTIGCAPPPMCSSGCTAVCGCCACGEGMVEGDLICAGGCWKPLEGCNWLGHTYPPGATFNAGDGCNTCGCSVPGGISCTKKACLCDPTAEVHRREYKNTNPAACSMQSFACTGTTTFFSNMCGCGCEQDPACPDFFDCQPSPDVPPCDTVAIKMKCPYSGIAF
jgi:hypothetical protein